MVMSSVLQLIIVIDLGHMTKGLLGNTFAARLLSLLPRARYERYAFQCATIKVVSTVSEQPVPPRRRYKLHRLFMCQLAHR